MNSCALRPVVVLAACATLVGCGKGDGVSTTFAPTAPGATTTAPGADTASSDGPTATIVSGEGVVRSLCKTRGRRTLNAAERARMHKAVTLMGAAYAELEGDKRALAQEQLIALSAGMVRQCSNAREAGRLLKAMADARRSGQGRE